MASRAETLEAFRLSIKKWKGLAKGEGVDLGCTNCALCRVFKFGSCDLCPVAQHSGKALCRKTPYMVWLNHSYQTTDGRVAEGWMGRKAARKEHDFLVWLRNKWRREHPL